MIEGWSEYPERGLAFLVSTLVEDFIVMRLVRTILFTVSMASITQTLPGKTPAPLLVDPAALPPTKSVPVFGQRIVYYDVGSGPTVVLLHGVGSQAMFDWGQVIMPLSQSHRVIALDQIGFGESDKPLIDYSIQTFVDFLGEFLRTVGVQQFTLAGESLGGWIAASYSIQALAPGNTGAYALPEPQRLILVDAPGQSDSSETIGDKLAGITVPTLVVCGGNDELIPLNQGREYATKISKAKLVIIQECGHVPPLEKPEAFLSAVTPFLK